MTQGEFELALNRPKHVRPNIRRKDIFETLDRNKGKNKKITDLQNDQVKIFFFEMTGK